MRYVCCYPESKQPTSCNKLQNGWVEAINRQFGWVTGGSCQNIAAFQLARDYWDQSESRASQLVKLPVNALTTQISEFLKSRSF
jgi:hypothetical protein